MGYAPQILSTIHLTTTLLAAWIVIDGTGGIFSPFSFLYLLVVLDASIIGSLNLALLIATLSFCFFSSHLIFKYYSLWPQIKDSISFQDIGPQILSHLFGVYLLAILAGRLAKLLEYAEQEAINIRSDLVELSYQHTAILESLPLGVMTFDNHDIIKTANHAASEILNIPKPKLLGKPLPHNISQFISRTHGQGELELLIRDTTRTLKLTYATVSLQTQVTSGLQDRLRVLVFEDFTEMRHLEAKYRMQDRLAATGQLAASIAHEIRNPLAAISGAIQLLEPQDDASSDELKLQNIVHREIDRLNLLISDFLNYARPPSPELKNTNLSELSRDVVLILKSDHNFSDKNIETILTSDDLHAEVDQKQMHQVLWNLLRNALEASPPDGAVTLQFSTDFLDNQECISIKISDTGPGISPEIRDNIFEPFVTNKSNGTGLGLAVAHRIIVAHHGQIEAQDNDPKGTIFAISLPIRPPA
ncbi:MAG: ATP-binding protein [Myxococcota bacterium]|nr:ATP-binding protein [Myxococcota bacterium]